MARDEDFQLRPGRIRSRGEQRARPFVAQALAAAQKAGGQVTRGRVTAPRASRFGRGRSANIRANHLLSTRSREVVVKARVVRMAAKGANLAAHLSYLRREGVTRDGEKARMFGADSDAVDPAAFAKRCEEDRHHFRFIVSPDDAADLADLRRFGRDLMGQMQADLGTRLDWVGVDHWNTAHPHLHILVRGRGDDGRDLVIARDYIATGLRARAQDLVTQELGPRTDLDIRQALERQVEAERWTRLDRALARQMDSQGVIDTAPVPGEAPDDFLSLKLGRLRKLEGLGLARQLAPGQWTLSPTAEATLRELGERGDIIKRIHQGLAADGIERAAASYVLAGEALAGPVIGRLVARGLDDELRGSAFAVIDGVDGRTHHVRLPDLDAASDSPAGSIVELRRYQDGQGRRRVSLAVRSDLDIAGQVTAGGATWLDRQLLARDPPALGSGGFGAEVKTAMAARIDHLLAAGLARQEGDRVLYARGLLDRLRRQELERAGARLAAETGLSRSEAIVGDRVAGTYRQRQDLASGRFAMVDDGLGFSLVPWVPSLEKQLGRQVSGIVRTDGGVDWALGRKRGLGI